jgi:RecA-family ATPase
MPKEDHRLKNALHYAEQGFKLFPAIYKEGKHQGLVKWGKQSTSSPSIIAGWARQWPNCYFCVALNQSNMCVIDVDIKNGKQGEEVFSELQKQHGLLPKTLTVTTPSGGAHYYFKGAIGNTGLGQDIDTPAMVPLPGSIVRDKGEYVLSRNTGFATVVTWVKDIAGEHVKRKERKEAKIPLDAAHNIDAAKQYLSQDAPVSIEGERGDPTAYKVACRVHELGVSEDMALELMSEYWNDRCQPEWSLKDLQRKIANAYEYAQNPLGMNTAEYEDLIVEAEEPEDHGVRSLKDEEGASVPREWILDKWLPKDEVCAFYGSGGLGKSRLAIQLGLHVAAGEDFLGIPVETKMPVLYVPCEDKREEVTRRIDSIMNHRNYELIFNYDLPFYSMSRATCSAILVRQDKRSGKLVKGKFYDILRGVVKRLFKGAPSLLILDTLTDIFKVDMNDSTVSSQCVKNILGGLQKELNVTILVIAHPSKTGLATGTLDSGSPGWLNSYRFMMAQIEYENKALTDYSYVKMAKSNYSRIQEPILIRYDEGILTEEDMSNIIDETKEKNKETLLKVIEKHQDISPIGMHIQSRNCIRDIGIKDAAGGMMSPQTKIKLINELLVDSLVVEIRGKKRGNGLRLIETEDLE